MGKELDPSLAKAWTFFERARKVAETNNFDYAIEMYLEGLKCAPDALEDGHLKLYALALHRKAKGGKKPSMLERAKFLKPKKDPLEQMLSSEYLFARDTDHLPYAESFLKAAVAGGYKKTARWVADMLFQANNSNPKPSFDTYILLKDSYSSLSLYDRALAACQKATQLKPNDAELSDEFRRLSAELTVSKGRYDQQGDFRNSINNRQAQEQLHAQSGVVKSENYRLAAVEGARKNYEDDPELAKNIFGLAEALSGLDTDEGESEAVALLHKAYESKKDFSYEQRAGQVRIKQLKRIIRRSKAVFEANKNDEIAKEKVVEFGKKLRETELNYYRLCSQHYPTDMNYRYEYGVRLLNSRQYDDAIPLFQESQRDPKHRISSMSKMGLCFFLKGWYGDAADIFSRAIQSYESEDDGIGKELRYNLGRAYEEQGELDKALDIYRKIAQMDFAYRDVRARIDKMRKTS